MRLIFFSLCFVPLLLGAQNQINVVRINADSIYVQDVVHPDPTEGYFVSIQNSLDGIVIAEYYTLQPSDTFYVPAVCCNILVQRSAFVNGSWTGSNSVQLELNPISFEANMISQKEVLLQVEGDFTNSFIEFRKFSNPNKRYPFYWDNAGPYLQKTNVAGSHEVFLVSSPDILVATLVTKYPGCTQKVGRILYVH